MRERWLVGGPSTQPITVGQCGFDPPGLPGPDDFQVVAFELFPWKWRDVVEGDPRITTAQDRESVREKNRFGLIQEQAAVDGRTQFSIRGRCGSINNDQNIASGIEKHFLRRTSTDVAESNPVAQSFVVEAFDPLSVGSDQS